MSPTLQANMKTCPRCAENIQVAAVVCPHCRSELSPPLKRSVHPVVALAIVALAVWMFFGVVPWGTVFGPSDVATTSAMYGGSSSAGSGITMANYSQLQDGMSYDAVKSVLGEAGTEVSSSELAGTRTVMYQWKSDGLGNMNAMFQNGKLVQKAQFGLR